MDRRRSAISARRIWQPASSHLDLRQDEMCVHSRLPALHAELYLHSASSHRLQCFNSAIALMSRVR